MNAGGLTISDIKQWDILVSLDSDHVTCPLCKGNAIELIDDMCPSCADDMLYMMTGCRFGDRVSCTPALHPDCE